MGGVPAREGRIAPGGPTGVGPSPLGLDFRIFWAGRNAQGAWDELAAEYRQRIAAWHPIEERAVRVRGTAEDPHRSRMEGEALRSAAPPDGWWIALDRLGRPLDSDEMARKVAAWRQEWSRPVVFFVGSDIGLDRELLAACRERWSLGALTLPHGLARLVLLEQLYRSLSILEGIQYHRRPL